MASFIPVEEDSAPPLPTLAAYFCLSVTAHPVRSGHLSSHKPYCRDLPDSARFAVAGARPLVLDSHLKLPNERSRLRDRMVKRATSIVYSLGSQSLFAQFHSLSLVARRCL